MMKHILPILIFLSLSFVQTFGQSFSLSDDNGPIANGTVVQVIAAPSTEIVTFRASIKNNSTATKSLKARKTHIAILPNTFNTFCWAGTCYAPTTFVSPDLLTLAPGQTSGRNDFYSDYLPENQAGTSKIRYTFFDSTNPNDSVSVIVHFVTSTTGADDLIATPTDIISNPFPNPASFKVSFILNLSSKQSNPRIILRNIMGATVIEQPITQRSGDCSLAVEHLKEGVYFYTLLVNSNTIIKTGKLIIKR